MQPAQPVQQMQPPGGKHSVTTEPRGAADTTQLTTWRKDYLRMSSLQQEGKNSFRTDVSKSDSNFLTDALT